MAKHRARGGSAPAVVAALLLSSMSTLPSLPGAARAEDSTPALDSLAGRPVSRLEYAGHELTKPYVIEREIRTAAGSPFSPSVFESDRIRLLNLGVFANVEATATADGDSVRVHFDLRELPAILPYPRLNYTVENGWAVGLGIASPNLTGRAIRLGASTTFGGTNLGDLSFTHPWVFGNHGSVQVWGRARGREDKLNGFFETSEEVSLILGSYLGETGRLWVYGGYFELGSDTPGKTLDPDDEDESLPIGVRVGWDSRDNYEDPRRGGHSQVRLEWTGGFGEYAPNFWTVEADLRRYVPTFERQKLLASTLVTMRTGEVGRTVPSYMQFYMGGANTIRGYDLFELGPTLFGKNQTIVTVEYQYALVEPREVQILFLPLRFGIQLAGFADWGIAWSEGADFNTDRGKLGVGAGVRLLVPGTEMLRFDFAHGEDGKIRFAFGADIKLDAQKNRLR